MSSTPETGIAGPAPALAPSRARVGRGIAMMLLAMFLFASMDAVNKHLSQTYAITQILWIRFLFFAVFAVLIAGPARVPRLARSAAPWMQAMRAILLIGEIGVFIVALKYLPMADVHALAAASPLLVTLLAIPILGERVDLQRWAAVGLGFLGVLVILRPGFAVIDARLTLPLFAALLFALYQIMLRAVARHDGPDTTLLYSAFVGAAFFTVIGPFDWRAPAAIDWLWLLLSALLGSLAHFALIRALDFAPASRLQPYGYALMVWATVFGFLVFGQFPDGWTIAGAGLIVAGGLYAFYRERRQIAA